MTTFADMVYMLGGVPVGAFDPVLLAGGRWYFCDPTHGSANADGTSPETACSNLKTVYDKCRDAYNDGVIMIGGATAYSPAAAFDWSKNYTHLLGASSSVPGKGQRCRVVALAATALTQAMTISGSGCVVKNIQFNNEKASGASGSAVVSGLRNRFDNCFFMNPTSVTSASWALQVTGSENSFVRCSIGQMTNARSTSSYGLLLKTAANSLKFIGCEFQSWSDQTAHVPVYIDSSITSEAWQLQFEDCLFQNLGNASLAYGIVDGATDTYHQIIFRGNNNLFVKITAVSDQLSKTYVADTKTGSTSGLMAVAVAES
jgi:hypothetical protein